MNKKELVAAIAEKSEVTKKDVEKVMQSFTEVEMCIRDRQTAGWHSETACWKQQKHWAILTQHRRMLTRRSRHCRWQYTDCGQRKLSLLTKKR